MAEYAEIGVLGQVTRPFQYSCSPLGLEVERVAVLWRGTKASSFHAAAFGLLRNMTTPTPTHHTMRPSQTKGNYIPW